MALALLCLATGALGAPGAGRPGVCDVRTYGATGNGITNDTAAIQRAIDSCAGRGGGRVELRSGTFRSGTLVLKNHITLFIARGATLLGSPTIEDYRPFPPEDVAKIALDGSTQSKGNGPYHLIHADGAVDIAIEGGGVIAGNGAAFWDKVSSGDLVAHRPRPSPLIEFVATRGVRIQGITIRDAPGWTIHPLESAGIRISGIVIRNDPKGPNTDAIDVDSSHDVVVSDADIIAGDDCVVLKTTGRRSAPPVPATENVLVRRIRCSSDDQGIKIGTESLGDFRNIEIRDVLVYRAAGMYRPPTAGISMSMVDGAGSTMCAYEILLFATPSRRFLSASAIGDAARQHPSRERCPTSSFRTSRRVAAHWPPRSLAFPAIHCGE